MDVALEDALDVGSGIAPGAQVGQVFDGQHHAGLFVVLIVQRGDVDAERDFAAIGQFTVYFTINNGAVLTSGALNNVGDFALAQRGKHLLVGFAQRVRRGQQQDTLGCAIHQLNNAFGVQGDDTASNRPEDII